LWPLRRARRRTSEGLDAAHERGLIHRDIKPANIYLEAGTDRVKIVDFGLARAVSDDLHLTRTGTIVGTPAYMSPEQARGAPVDQCSDRFSLGSVLYRMCTGRTPFLAEDTMSMLLALANDQPPPIAAFNNLVPGPLIRLIDQLLAKLPEARPQSARVVAAKLCAIENALAAFFGAAGRRGPTRARRRHPAGRWPPGFRSSPRWGWACPLTGMGLARCRS
jgi:serine/threonine protein kinase